MSAERERRAWHLASHAYAATMYGFSVHKLSLEGFSAADLADRGDAQCLDEGTMIHVPVCPRPIGSFEHTLSMERLMSIALAGPCAELLHRQIPCAISNVQQFTVDWTQAWRAVSYIWSDDTSRHNMLSRWTHSSFGVIFYGVKEFYSRVVPQLLERGTVTGEDVQAAWNHLKATEEASSSQSVRRRRPIGLEPDDPECLGSNFPPL